MSDRPLLMQAASVAVGDSGAEEPFPVRKRGNIDMPGGCAVIDEGKC
jgi:hypothetical protein